ncbi:MAG: ATP phosphoribosyltransferase regulatory subunit, partial [Clostridia bacterium]|nr:ATP phosphoribosyltransferase regulatory subunit [Clostridia bacterium]
MKLTPTEGMRDYLPSENSIRDSLMQTIRGIYRANGFRAIETPAVESLENLENSDGGDNLKLIYRLEKRGQKLEKAIEAGDFAHLCDLGLRYDLTLPLSRYYACHKNELETPFKTIQIGRVYRAERPQKGRLREFVQCDID